MTEKCATPCLMAPGTSHSVLAHQLDSFEDFQVSVVVVTLSEGSPVLHVHE